MLEYTINDKDRSRDHGMRCAKKHDELVPFAVPHKKLLAVLDAILVAKICRVEKRDEIRNCVARSKRLVSKLKIPINVTTTQKLLNTLSRLDSATRVCVCM